MSPEDSSRPLFAILESPLQALNSVEYARRFGKQLDLVLVADRPGLATSNRDQIVAILELAGVGHIFFASGRIDPRRPFQARATVARAERVVQEHFHACDFEVLIGEYRAAFGWALARRLDSWGSDEKPRPIVVVDDGSAVLNINRRSAMPQPVVRTLTKRALLGLGGLRGDPPTRSITFFSAFDIGNNLSPSDRLVHNDLRSLRDVTLALPPDVSKVYVVGSPLREAGVVQGDDVDLALNLCAIASSWSQREVIYVAHRRESNQKLEALRKEVEVMTPSVPFELMPQVVGVRPTLIFGYYSSVFTTMSLILGVNVTVVSAPLPKGVVARHMAARVANVYSTYRHDSRPGFIRLSEHDACKHYAARPANQRRRG